jgi:hypothetical protein
MQGIEVALGMIQADPILMAAAVVVVLGIFGLAIEAVTAKQRTKRAELKAIAEIKAAAASQEPEDPIVANRRFFATLTHALAVDESADVGLAALHANLTADVFMERMNLAAKAWQPDGFAVGARKLSLKAEGTPPDEIASKVLEGYEELKAGRVQEAMNAFLNAIEKTQVADASNPWPHAWSGFAWRGLALIAEETGDVQATLAGLKVAYQSMVNAYRIETKA